MIPNKKPRGVAINNGHILILIVKGINLVKIVQGFCPTS